MARRLCKLCKAPLPKSDRAFTYCDTQCFQLAEMYEEDKLNNPKRRGKAPSPEKRALYRCACGCGASVERYVSMVKSPHRVYVNKTHMGAHRSLSSQERPVRLSGKLMIGLGKLLNFGIVAKQVERPVERLPLTTGQQIALLGFDPEFKEFRRPRTGS